MITTAPKKRFAPWPAPVVPVKCPKCGRYRVPVTNMAHGIRFGTHGRVFSKRGINFVNDLGKCCTCDFDNPPGSGRNTSACANCPGGQGPASVLISFIGQTFPTCQQFCGPNSSRVTINATLGDYCASMGSDGFGNCSGTFADPTPGDFITYFASDSGCATPFATPIYFSGTVTLFGSGWFAVLYGNVPSFGIIIKLFESPITPGDCTTSTVVTSTTFPTAMCNPRNNQYPAGGGAVISPQYHLCA